MTEIVDCESLYAAVARWLDVETDTAFTAMIPQLVQLAQARIGRGLRTRHQLVEAVLNTRVGIDTLDLPADFVELWLAYTSTTQNVALERVSPQQALRAYRADQRGEPRECSILGDRLKLHPIPDGIYPVRLTYYAAIPALTRAAPSNWLLSKYPELLLYATLLQAAPYTGDDERVALWTALYNEARRDIEREDRASRFGVLIKAPSGVMV
jgi:hypothetical protein